MAHSIRNYDANLQNYEWSPTFQVFNDLKQALSTAASNQQVDIMWNYECSKAYEIWSQNIKLNMIPAFKVFEDPNSPSMHCKQQDDIMQNVEYSPAFET